MNETIQLNGTVFYLPYSDLVRKLTDSEYTALRDDIAQRGVVVPVIVDEYNNVIDGHHRLRIAVELGLFPPMEILAYLDDDEKRSLAVDLNHRRRLELFARETKDGWTTWGNEA